MPSFLGGIIGGLIAKVVGWFALIGIGEQRRSEKDMVATVDALEREAEAAAGAPKSKADALRRLEDGTA